MAKTRQRKPKKIPLRDLAPICFQHISVEWNEDEKKEIRLIEKKYICNSDFDFLAHLAQLPTHAETILEAMRQHPSTNEKHQIMDAICNAALEIECLKTALLRLQSLMDAAGSIILPQIARNTAGQFKTIQQIRDASLPHVIQEFEMLDVNPLIQGCIKTKQQIPPTKAGRHRDPFKLAIIQYLVAMYVCGTGKEPTCSQDRPNGTHTGECYEFITDLNCMILKALDKQFDKNDTIDQCLYFDKESTIGQYICEELTYRKNRLLESYTTLACCLMIIPSNYPQILSIILQLESAFLTLLRHPHIA